MSEAYWPCGPAWKEPTGRLPFNCPSLAEVIPERGIAVGLPRDHGALEGASGCLALLFDESVRFQLERCPCARRVTLLGQLHKFYVVYLYIYNLNVNLSELH